MAHANLPRSFSLEELRKKEEKFALSQKNVIVSHRFTTYQFRPRKSLDPLEGSFVQREEDLILEEFPSKEDFLQILEAVVEDKLPLCPPELISIERCGDARSLRELEQKKKDSFDKNRETLSRQLVPTYTIRETRYASLFCQAAEEGSVPFEPIPLEDEPPDPTLFNVDSHLWTRVQENLNPETSEGKIYANLYSAPKVVSFIAEKAGSINAFNKEKASVFLTLVVKLMRLRLTPRGLRKLFRHSSPYVRAAGLVIARYLLPPEVVDEVLIQPHLLGLSGGVAGEPDMTERVVLVQGASMRLCELCRKLIEEDEVLEAWFPIYPSHAMKRLQSHLEDVSKGRPKAREVYESQETDSSCFVLCGFPDARRLALYVYEKAKQEGERVPGSEEYIDPPPTPQENSQKEGREEERRERGIKKVKQGVANKTRRHSASKIRIHGEQKKGQQALERLLVNTRKEDLKRKKTFTPYL